MTSKSKKRKNGMNQRLNVAIQREKSQNRQIEASHSHLKAD